MEFVISLLQLRWQPTFQLHPLPSHITRTFVPSQPNSNYTLELLASTPKLHDPAASSLFFVHGGYGSAAVWLEWMTYLHDAGYGGKLYAYSARNHGGSYGVGYLRMVYGTSLIDLTGDLEAVVEFACQGEKKGEIVLVVHSSGGGLTQYALAMGLVRCRGLCLVDAIPHYGALSVYANWARHDPWFMLRSFLHLQHPTSPLSSPRLVHGAFFSTHFPRSAVEEFMKWMPRYESLGWPMGMMGSFVGWWRGTPYWLDVRKILGEISGSDKCDRVCVMVGSCDVLMDVEMARKEVAEYGMAMRDVESRSGLAKIEGANIESGGGVRLVVVEGAGHHLQNDLQRDVGAAALLDFVRQFRDRAMKYI